MNPDISRYSGIIGGLAAILAMTWLLNRIKPNAEQRDDGSRMVRYHPIMSIIGWVGTLFFLTALVAFGFKNTRQSVGGMVVFGIFALGSMFMIRAAARCRISYTDLRLCYTPMF